MPEATIPSPPAPGTLGRRTTLGAALGLVLLSAGCRSGGTAAPAASTAEPPEPSSSTAPTNRPATGVDADVRVATRALVAINTTEALVGATIARHPRLRRRLATLRACHRVHAAALVDAVPEDDRTDTAPAPTAVPADRARALVTVAAAETALHAQLVGLALAARSGPFASLLASMAAGVRQRQVAGDLVVERLGGEGA